MERLDDGTLILTVEGIQYRALPVARLRALLNLAEDKRLLEEQIRLLNQQLELSGRTSQLDQRERELYAEQVKQLGQEIETLKRLFALADQQARPGRIRRFLDKPLTAIMLEIVAPVAMLFARLR
jgi:hypothetical protein